MSAKSRLQNDKDKITIIVNHGDVHGFFKTYRRFGVCYGADRWDIHEITPDHPDYEWLTEHSIDYATYKAQKKQQKIESKTIVRTRILDSGTSVTTKKSGGVGRAIAGGIIAGPVGAVVGATTAGHKTTSTNYTVFKVWYQDGHTEVEKVEHGTPKYKRYLEMIED